MFLVELSNKEQNCFFNLAIALVKADGKITTEELNTLNLYKSEIHTMKDISNYGNDNIEEDIEYFANSDKRTRKKVYFELISLAYTDSDYSDDEKNFIDNLAKKWNICFEDCEKIKKLSEEVINRMARIGEWVNE